MYFTSICSLVFSKTKELLGGQMRLIISGGAPLTRSTHEQIETFFCVKLIQGYGLTETTSGATLMDGKYSEVRKN